MSVPLFALTAMTLGWSVLTSIVAYKIMVHKYASKDAYNFAIAGITVSITVFIVFALYAYTRSTTEEDDGIDIESGLVGGFRWYDAVILFFMLGLCGIAIALSSILIDYEEQAREKDKEQSSTIRDVAISNIVLSVIILLLYVTYLFVQDRLPLWCQEYATRQKEQRERMQELYGGERERRTSKEGTGVTVVLQQGGTQPEAQKRRDSLSLEDEDY